MNRDLPDKERVGYNSKQRKLSVKTTSHERTLYTQGMVKMFKEAKSIKSVRNVSGVE